MLVSGMSAIDDIQLVDEIVEQMIQLDTTITFRQVSERSDGRFPHATSLTRREHLRERVEKAVERQKAVRAVALKFSKSSPARSAARIAALEAEVASLRDQVQLLTSSHRAAILAIGRIGGMKGWREHFPAYSEAVNTLVEMGALPQAEVQSLDPRKADT